MNLSAINFRSPITWVVIIAGGVAVYFLFRYFQNQNAANSTSTAPTTGASVPAVGTSLFLEAPSEATSTTPTTTTPTTTKTTSTGLTATYASVQAEAKQEGSSLAKELQDKVNAGYTITSVPSGVTIPKKTASTTTSDPDHDKAASGGGIPDTSNYVHVSTWPYGGQMVRSRLG